MPRDSLNSSNSGATLIASIKPYQPNQMLLLGWLARQDSVPRRVGSDLGATTGQSRTEGERESERFGERMQHYTALLRQDGPYAPKDNRTKRTGALLSDLDSFMTEFRRPR